MHNRLGAVFGGDEDGTVGVMEHQSHNCLADLIRFLEQRVPQERALIRLVCMAKGSRWREMLTSAPSLMSRPNRSRSTWLNRARECPDRAQIDHKGAQVCPNGDPAPALRRLGLEALGAHGRHRHAATRASRRLDLRDFDAS